MDQIFGMSNVSLSAQNIPYAIIFFKFDLAALNLDYTSHTYSGELYAADKIENIQVSKAIARSQNFFNHSCQA